MATEPIKFINGIPVFEYEIVVYEPMDSFNYIKLYRDKKTKEVIEKEEITRDEAEQLILLISHVRNAWENLTDEQKDKIKEQQNDR
jgi:hypothetical protein